MANHTLQVPYGVDGYLCLIMSYRPDIAWEYLNAVKAGDFETSWRMIREIEYPLRDLLTSFGVSMNSAWHGLSEVFGISGRYLPLPYYTLNDEQMEILAQGAKDIGFLR